MRKPNAQREPMADGPASGHVVHLEPMLDEYYRLMGWNQDGVPTDDCLHDLELTPLLNGYRVP